MTGAAVLASPATVGLLARPRRSAPGGLAATAGFIQDVLTLALVVVSVPLVILAIGTPLALGVRLVLWLVAAIAAAV